MAVEPVWGEPVSELNSLRAGNLAGNCAAFATDSPRSNQLFLAEHGTFCAVAETRPRNEQGIFRPLAGKISAKQGKKCWQQGQLGRLRFFGALPNAQLDPRGSANDLVDRGMRIGADQENDLQKLPNVEAALPNAHTSRRTTEASPRGGDLPLGQPGLFAGLDQDV